MSYSSLFCSLSLIVVPPCGCFKCALLWFLPGALQLQEFFFFFCKESYTTKPQKCSQRCKPHHRSYRFPFLLSLPSVLVKATYQNRWAAYRRQTGRGRREGWLISLWYAKSHIHTFTAHTCKQPHTHTHLLQALLSCHFVLIQLIEGPAREEGEAGQCGWTVSGSGREGDQETAGRRENIELCVAFELADVLCPSSSHRTLFNMDPMCLLLCWCQHMSGQMEKEEETNRDRTWHTSSAFFFLLLFDIAQNHNFASKGSTVCTTHDTFQPQALDLEREKLCQENGK